MHSTEAEALCGRRCKGWWNKVPCCLPFACAQAQRAGAGRVQRTRLHHLQCGWVLCLFASCCKARAAATSGGSSRQQPGFVLQCGWIAGRSAAPISQGLNPTPSCRIAGAFPANRFTSFMTSPTSIDVSLKHRQMVRCRSCVAFAAQPKGTCC